MEEAAGVPVILTDTSAVLDLRHTYPEHTMMTNEYRVVDVKNEVIDLEPKTVMAYSPEKAAELALGVELVRSGSQRDLRARVYYQRPGQPTNMVRLYTKAADRDQA